MEKESQSPKGLLKYPPKDGGDSQNPSLASKTGQNEEDKVEKKDNKPNWHSRKISWGKDSIFGELKEAQGNAAAASPGGNTDSDISSSKYLAEKLETMPEGKVIPASSSNESVPSAADVTSSATTVGMGNFKPEHDNDPQQKPTLFRKTSSDAACEESSEPELDVNDAQAAAIQSLFADANAVQAAHIQNLFAGAPPKRTKQKRISSLGNVDLADILKECPIETEAETYILNAIEQREISANTEANTNTTIVNTALDDAISALTSTNDGVRDGDDAEYASLENTASHAGSHISPGMSATPPSFLNRYHRHQHRRNQTMEQQLNGLADALDAMQTNNDFHHRTNSNLATLNEYGIGTAQSSAEILQQNASLLVDHNYEASNTTRRRLLTRNQKTSWRNLDASASRRRLSSADLSSLPKSSDAQSMEEESANKSDSKDPPLSSSSLATNGVHPYSIRNIKMHPKKTDGDSSINMTPDLMPMPLTNVEEQGEEDDIEANNGEDQKQEQDIAENKGEANRRKKSRAQQTLRELQDFFEPQKTTIALYLRVVFLYIALPLLAIAAALFYFAHCPPTGRLANEGRPINGTLYNTHGEIVDPTAVSTSWWLIFVVRQLVTFTLSKCLEKIFVDYLTIRTKATINVFGPWLTLFVLQSRGWPSTVTLWSVLNFCLLFGSHSFVKQWMFWQDVVGVFNAENPSGEVLDSDWNMEILVIGLILGITVSLKRLLLGFHLGKRTFSAYSDQLAKIMKNILMISEVAALAKDFEREMKIRENRKDARGSTYVHKDKLFDIFDDLGEDGASAVGAQSSGTSAAEKSVARGNVQYIIDTEDRNPWSGLLSYTQQQRIIQLLGAWEEPVIAERQIEYISVTALLQFRRSMACLNTPFPFSGAFGLADTREHCIQSSQELYRRLLLNDPDQGEVSFETLALLGLKPDGSLDQDKLKEMIRLFRPDRDGTLGILEFAKSIDSVYKELRMLRASVTNASKIDRSFEIIINWIFYAIAITVILGQLGFSPMALFLSISGVILGFAFMIGSASSKYFEGLLFILVRRPYAIGDGIHVMNIESEALYSGHPFWYVEDVTLFTTSVMFSFTGERATLSNGSLANSRIVNSRRSPQASMYILLKFPVNVTHEKLQIFNDALEQFFKNRPREWRSYDSFRAARLDAEAGFIEYLVAATHRSSWYEWTAVHTSKADMIHFSLELSKQLGIAYRTPPVPVDLNIQDPPNFPFVPTLGRPLSGGSATTVPSGLAPLQERPDLSSLQSMFPPRMR